MMRIVLAILLLGTAQPMLFSEGLDLIYLGGWPGFIRGSLFMGIEIQDDYAYVAANGSGLVVFDVSTRDNPRPIGVYDRFYDVRGIKVVENIAYLAAAESGLQAVDISNPRKPVWIGGSKTTSFAVNLDVRGHLAYIADLSALDILDVAVPSNPVRVGQEPTGSFHRNVQIVGNYAYTVHDYEGFQITDVADPAKPFRVGGYGISDYCRGVRVGGDVAYVTSGRALQIMDVRNPIHPVLITNYTLSGASSLDLVGSLAYVSAYGRVQILDVSNSALPRALGSFGTAGIANEVDVHNGYAYVAEGLDGLSIGDVRNSTSPYLVGQYRKNAGATVDLQVREGVAYLADTQSLQMLDVSDPANPTELWREPVFGPPTTAINVQGNYAYVLCNSDMQIFDVSNPRISASRKGFYSITLPSALQVVSNYCYIGKGFGGFEIVKLNTPTNGFKAGQYSGTNRVTALHLSGGLLFLGSAPRRLEIIDIVNPTSPMKVGEYQTQSPPHHIVVKNGLAFLAEGTNGVEVVDVHNPAEPRGIGRIETGSDARGIQVLANYLYVAAGTNGVRIFDVTDAERPIYVGGLDVVGSAANLAIGKYIYVASAGAGLQIVQLPLQLKILGVDGGVPQVQVIGPAGSVAQVQSSANLNDWLDVGQQITLNGGAISITNDNAGLKPQQFYRAVLH